MKLTFTLIILCFSLELMAQKAGTLDSSFGINGKVLTGFGNNVFQCFASLSQPDDKIVTAGFGYIISDTSTGFLAMRYKEDGTPDSSFGKNGISVINLGSDYEIQVAFAVAIQLDKKIVLSGYITKGPLQFNEDIATIRLNENGSIDSSFGGNGIVIADYSTGDAGYDLVIQPDGKIIVEGVSNGSFITIRYLPDGTPDDSFGDKGKIETTFDKVIFATSVVLQHDGKIIAAGYDEDKVLMVRYLPDGKPDGSFGIDGTVSTDLTSTSDRVNDVVLQSDGKIVVAGETRHFIGDRTLIARYDSTGSLDSSFGIKGFITNTIPYSSDAERIMLQKDGKIITGGVAGTSEDDLSDFIVSRFTSTGIADSSFGTFGYTITPGIGAAYGLSMQNNKIVLAGNYEYPQYVSLARYNNDDLTKKQIIVQKIKHYIQTHNAQATTLNNVSVYPNPAQSILHIQGLSSNAKLTVVDLNGSIAVSRELRAVSGVYDLNIASLHAGNYLLKIETNGEVVTKQFVKE